MVEVRSNYEQSSNSEVFFQTKFYLFQSSFLEAIHQRRCHHFWFGLVALFNGISTFVYYLLVEEHLWYYLT